MMNDLNDDSCQCTYIICTVCGFKTLEITSFQHFSSYQDFSVTYGMYVRIVLKFDLDIGDLAHAPQHGIRYGI